ncbi:MAG: long-chain fatty acid--CoA ligase [Nitrososphaerota archaeon]|nr:long-chain fatty acid--CoA ligase [Candidatus Nezhaarchaeota archaeon]MDW8050761.1 long-chain fatty acid--CoA ligase [Nitrososphaerota archaeon]
MGGQVPEDRPWFKFYPPGVRKHIDYPDKPLHELLREAARKFPNRTAIIYFDRKITFKELDALTDKFATALADLGVNKGDRVALFLPNCPNFVIAYYGTLKAGGVITAISPLARERELEYQINDSESETIVTLDLLYPLVEKVCGRTKLRNVIVGSIKDYMPRFKAFLGSLLKKIPSQKVERRANVYFFKELIARYEAKPLKVEINPKEDLACLLYTGGTTGLPKGTMLTHMNLVANALMCVEWLQAKEEVGEVVLTVLPLFHSYGMTTSMNAPMAFGGTIVLLPRFDVVQVLQAIEKYKVTIFCGVPVMYAMLLSHPDVKKYDLTSIKFCISGAAPLPPEIQKKFMELTNAVLVEGYGLTETSPVTHSNPLDRTMKTVKVGSIGIPWPDTDAKIVDLETGERELPPGEVGELIVRGPQVMKGYWKRPEETAQTLRNGWLYTGDIAKMDEDGYFYIVDRKKDLIKYKGYSVFARELEDILYEHPAVKLCAVIGKPDPVAGEIPKAFVVLKEGMTATAEELMKFVNERVAPYKAIRELEIRKELPLSAVGKVLRRVLREEELKKTATKT